jgi:hypothetical protein
MVEEEVAAATATRLLRGPTRPTAEHEAQDATASTSAAPLEPEWARQWARQSHARLLTKLQKSVKPSMTCINLITRMQINKDYKDTYFIVRHE